MTPALGRDAERLLRELTPQVLGALARRFDDFAACEDAVQEALLAAAEQWPDEGTPDEPRGWLIRVATRRMLDNLRSEEARRRREAAAAEDAPRITAPVHPKTAGALAAVLGASPGRSGRAGPEGSGVGASGASPEDDRLVLLFMCCHESLTTASAIALTLRAVGGLTTKEIARAFLVPEATMGQRISRAKRTIREAGATFHLPAPEERGRRLTAVLHVLYLIFNEGYTSSFGGSLQRTELADEAIRLVRAVHVALPGDPEVGGLLALMLLTDARRAARTGPSGELIPLAEQDRSLWDGDAIEEGTRLLEDAMARGRVGPYQLQAAIAALHDEADSVEDTDWPQILALYGVLERMSDSPMVTLNRAVATAMVEGPSAGLAVLDALEDDRRLGEHHRLAAVRAHLLERAGDSAAARRHYELAASRATNVPERDYLLARAARVG